MNSRDSISSAEMDASLRNSTIAGAVGMFFFMTVQNGPVPLLLEMLGAGGIAIGLSTTLYQLGLLAQIPAAFITEKLVKRKPFFALTNISGRALVLIPGIFLLAAPDHPQAAIVLILAVMGLFSFLVQMSAPAWFGWMAELVPGERRAAFWAQRQGWSMTTSLVTVALTGWFLDLFPEKSLTGFAWILIAAGIFGILDIIIHLFAHEPTPSPAHHGLSPGRRVLQPLKDRGFRYFTFAMCVWFFGLGFFAPFMNVYLKTAFGLTYTHLSAIQISGMGSSIVACFLGGRLIRRMGLRTYGLAMVLTVPLFSLAWLILDGEATGLFPLLGRVPQPVIVLCSSSMIAGGIYAAVALMQLNLLPVLSPAKGRTMAMAVHWSLVGALSALGPVAGGCVKDWFTLHPPNMHLITGTPLSWFHVLILLHAGMIWLVMFPLLLQIRKEEGEWPVQKAMADIFIFTPLRAARYIYNFNPAFGKTSGKKKS
ncbi:MFS transporter [Pontiella sp.]|uniref:MFS transporter n=1 Tax=Pontiella sp. TaxID=2837462 RepID=UPI00356A254E